MMRRKIKTLGWISILTLMAPLTPRAFGTTEAPTGSTSTATSTPAPRKHHHRRKKTTPDSAASNSADKHAGSAASGGGTPAGTVAAPGIPDNPRGNDAGQNNMGTQDHVPGTTGTSGQ